MYVCSPHMNVPYAPPRSRRQLQIQLVSYFQYITSSRSQLPTRLLLPGYRHSVGLGQISSSKNCSVRQTVIPCNVYRPAPCLGAYSRALPQSAYILNTSNERQDTPMTAKLTCSRLCCRRLSSSISPVPCDSSRCCRRRSGSSPSGNILVVPTPMPV